MEELLTRDLGLLADDELLNYNGATEIKNEYAEIPDGKYICAIKKVEAKVSNTNKTPYINIWTKVTVGDYMNQTIFIPLYFSEKIKSLSAKKIQRLAYTLTGNPISMKYFTDLQTLADALNQFVDGTVEVTVETTKNDFKNYTIEGIEE